MVTRLIAALVVAMVVTANPATAVTNGQPDGNKHPWVGVMIQPIPSMPGFVSVCTGAALSATKFLTAAHCADPGAPVYVSYDSDPTAPGSVFTPGSFTIDPDWCIECKPGLPGFDSHDVAVVILSVPVNPGGYAMLPPVGFVDSLPMKTGVDIVGYGVQGFIRGGGQPQQIFLFTRYFAPSQLVQSNNVQSKEFIKLTANPAQGKGGTCFGDSGGSDFLSGTNIILAVNSYVTNGNCTGVTYSQRVDLLDIQNFINGTN